MTMDGFFFNFNFILLYVVLTRLPNYQFSQQKMDCRKICCHVNHFLGGINGPMPQNFVEIKKKRGSKRGLMKGKKETFTHEKRWRCFHVWKRLRRRRRNWSGCLRLWLYFIFVLCCERLSSSQYVRLNLFSLTRSSLQSCDPFRIGRNSSSAKKNKSLGRNVVRRPVFMNGYTQLEGGR